MSSIRAAVKTIASFILHFLDTNCQGLDNTERVKSDENVSNSTVFVAIDGAILPHLSECASAIKQIEFSKQCDAKTHS